MKINPQIQPLDLKPKIERLWEVSAGKISALDRNDRDGSPAPTHTVDGRYVARDSTDATRGALYGSAILQFDAFWDPQFLRLGTERTATRMAPHLTHFGGLDHAASIVSTHGNLWRLMGEGRIPESRPERAFHELALKVSGAIHASRWTNLANGAGFIHSVHGPHSLLSESIRGLRALALAHQLGHFAIGEGGERICLLRRLVDHASTLAERAVFYGENRDAHDVDGRVAQESIYNVNDGTWRGPATRQGWSPFTTHMRSLAALLCGFAELLEWLATRGDAELDPVGGRDAIGGSFLRAARVTAEFYLENTPADGIPFWDTGAPGLAALGDFRERAADPFNDHEPVDSTAAVLAAQGFLRLGALLSRRGEPDDGRRYVSAGLTILDTAFGENYLATSGQHQGLILHSVSDRPAGVGHVPAGRRIPCGEATLAGDYSAREVALYVQRLYEGKPAFAFFGRPV